MASDGLPFGQIDLIGAVCEWIDRRGVKSINSRQMNAIIKAANVIMDALRTPHRPSSPGMGLAAWRHSDATGLSSTYMANVLSDSSAPGENNHPHDADDFGRCVRLLDAAPDLRPNLARLAGPEHGPVWNRIVAEWGTLEAWYREDLPTGRSKRLTERIAELKKP